MTDSSAPGALSFMIPPLSASRNTMRRPVRSTSQSPNRLRVGDELLSRLSPTSAIEALRAPSGALKTCLDNASAMEQSFAIRTAIAAKKIHEWLDEVSAWPWPSLGGSAVFEMPTTKRRKHAGLFETPEKSKQAAAQSEGSYIGSLPEKDVAQYEKRVEQIQKGLDELDLEEIKSQVLQNHIAPLSRPCSPFSDGGVSVISVGSYCKMEDLTAVVTAVTVKALPYLSKLVRLLNSWSVRLLVLRKVPMVLELITDAEVAMKSGWSAIEITRSDSADSPLTTAMHDISGKKKSKSEDMNPASYLSRQDFKIINGVLRQKVSKPGKDLDFMLDTLEGVEDTLPDSWLDRMEAVEKDYVEWVTTSERLVQEGELPSSSSSSSEHLGTPQPKIQIHRPSPAAEVARSSLVGASAIDASATLSASTSESLPLPLSFEQPLIESIESGSSSTANLENSLARTEPTHGSLQPSPMFKVPANEASARTSSSSSPDLDVNRPDVNRPDAKRAENEMAIAEVSSPDFDSATEDRLVPIIEHPASDDDSISSSPRQYRGGNGVRLNVQPSPVLSEMNRNVIKSKESFDSNMDFPLKASPHFDPENSFTSMDSVEEAELPPSCFQSRRNSKLSSVASTVVRSPRDGYSFRRGNSMEPSLSSGGNHYEYHSSGAISPFHSPPARAKPRTLSVTFKEAPEVVSVPKFSVTPPRNSQADSSLLEAADVFDPDSSFDYGSHLGSPSRMSVAGEDDHMQQQIREVLESIPTRIKLSSKTGAKIDLNPPDLKLPARGAKSKAADPFRRSGSAMSTMSSRPGTPAFLLAPAKTNRPRSRNSQDARAYYLSRAGGDAPMKLLIRCVGHNGERVMVRVGGGWADLGEYLKEYAAHHGRRSKGEGKVEVRDLPSVVSGRAGSSPPSRPGSALDSPMTPLNLRKSRRSQCEDDHAASASASSKMHPQPRTPLAYSKRAASTSTVASAPPPPGSGTPPSDGSSRSRASPRPFDEQKGTLGLSGPRPRKADNLTEENRTWIEDVTTKVRTASGDQRLAQEHRRGMEGKLGELGKVGSTKRMFRRG